VNRAKAIPADSRKASPAKRRGESTKHTAPNSSHHAETRKPDRAAQKHVPESKAGTDLLLAFENELSAQDSEKRCRSAFRSLTGPDRCAPDKLMWSVTTVKWTFEHHYRIQDEPCRMDSKKLATLVKKTLWVAGEWEQQFQTVFGKEVLQRAEGLDLPKSEGGFLRVPQRLRLLANEARTIHQGIRAAQDGRWSRPRGFRFGLVGYRDEKLRREYPPRLAQSAPPGNYLRPPQTQQTLEQPPIFARCANGAPQCVYPKLRVLRQTLPRAEDHR